MIDPKELRINNAVSFVRDSQWRLQYVKEIGEFGAALHDEKGLFMYSDLFPVPLSPELLEACGFETISPQSWYLPWESYELQYSTADKELGILTPHGCTSGHTVYFPCGHLHLLQNIFFFFAGADLPVNLEKVKV